MKQFSQWIFCGAQIRSTTDRRCHKIVLLNRNQQCLLRSAFDFSKHIILFPLYIDPIQVILKDTYLVVQKKECL